MASAKGFGAKGAAAGAERGAAKSILNEDLQETLDLLKKSLEQDAKLAAGETIKGKTKPTFRSPEEAAAYWDKVYRELSTSATKGIYPIGPNAPRITYKKDGQLFTLSRDVKPPEGAERVSLSNSDILKMMPPRPQVPPKPAGEPNAYNNPPPPDYLARTQPSPAAQEAIQTAKETVGAKAAPAPETPTLPREFRKSPSDTGPASTYVPPGSNQTVNLARETVAPKGPMSAPARYALALTPMAAAGGAGYMVNRAQNGPYGVGDYGTFVPEPGMTEPGMGVIAGNRIEPRFNQPNEPRLFRDELPPYMSPREESPNLDDVYRMSSREESPNHEIFAPDRSFAVMPEQSGRENPGMDQIVGQEQRFRPAYDAGQAQRFPPMGAVSTARQVIQRAQNSPTAQAQQAAAVMQQSPNELTVQKGADQGPNALTRFIRGDFREGADQRIMEAMRRQREESGVDSSTMARGGTAQKKSSKDDVLHKALEIIHHMLTRR